MADFTQYDEMKDDCEDAVGPSAAYETAEHQLREFKYHPNDNTLYPALVEAPTVDDLEEWYGNAHSEPEIFPNDDEPDLTTEFGELAKQWRSATAGLSVLMRKVMHPAYQQIIGMGPQAIPLILREMQRQPGHWFWALEAITRGKVLPAANARTLSEVSNAWIEWGKAEGHI